MPLHFAFWVLMFAWVASSLGYGWSTVPQARPWVAGWAVVLFLLFLIVGLRIFGAPLNGG